MGFVTRNHKQNVTYWTKGVNDLYGNPTWSTPITVKGRWEDRQDKAVDFRGNDIVTRSVVYLGIDLGVGVYLYLGTSAELSPPTDARELKGFTKIPSVRATEFERKAIL
jgi:hypothetical protein